MSISLEKGKSLNLSKEAEGLSEIIVGLGWDVIKKGFFSRNVDCDASAFLLDSKGKMINRNALVYFGNQKSSCNSVIHTGDNLTGAGDGDDEQIIVDLSKVPSNVQEIVFVVNIYQANSRGQHFGMVENAFMRIVDKRTNKQLAHFNLTEDYSNKTAMIFGSLYRENGQWQFKSIGEGTTDDGLEKISRRYK